MPTSCSPCSSRSYGKEASLWDAATGREQLWGGRTRLWDEPPARNNHGRSAWHTGRPRSMRMVVGSPQPALTIWPGCGTQPTARKSAACRTAQLLDTATGAEPARMRHDNAIQPVMLSPDGSQLATRAGKTANLWAI